MKGHVLVYELALSVHGCTQRTIIQKQRLDKKRKASPDFPCMLHESRENMTHLLTQPQRVDRLVILILDSLICQGINRQRYSMDFFRARKKIVDEIVMLRLG